MQVGKQRELIHISFFISLSLYLILFFFLSLLWRHIFQKSHFFWASGRTKHTDPSTSKLPKTNSARLLKVQTRYPLPFSSFLNISLMRFLMRWVSPDSVDTVRDNSEIRGNVFYLPISCNHNFYIIFFSAVKRESKYLYDRGDNLTNHHCKRCWD